MFKLIKKIVKKMKFSGNYYFKSSKLKKSHKVKIYSKNASLSAHYGYKVLISKGTVITNDVFLGDYSYVNINSYIENAIIGKFCSISSNVSINPGEHPLDRITTYPIEHLFEMKPNNFNKRVVIGNDVLISTNAIILEGVYIGDGAVVGAGAVVTHDIPAYAVVGGVPAKVIKYRFSPQVIKKLQEIRWWDWTEEKICREKEMFLNKLNLE